MISSFETSHWSIPGITLQSLVCVLFTLSCLRSSDVNEFLQEFRPVLSSVIMGDICLVTLT